MRKLRNRRTVDKAASLAISRSIKSETGIRRPPSPRDRCVEDSPWPTSLNGIKRAPPTGRWLSAKYCSPASGRRGDDCRGMGSFDRRKIEIKLKLRTGVDMFVGNVSRGSCGSVPAAYISWPSISFLFPTPEVLTSSTSSVRFLCM